MNQRTRNPLLHPRPHPVNVTTAENRQLLNPSRSNPTVPRDAVHGRPAGDIETSGTVPITETSQEPRSVRARDDAEARVASRRQPRVRVRKEGIREFIKVGAIVGATILAMRLYAAIAPPSPW